MNFTALSIAAAGVFALAMPCGSPPRLPSSLEDATGTVREAENTAREADYTAREAKRTADDVGEVVSGAEECARLRKMEVVFEEERALGEATALELAKRTQGVLFDANSEEAIRYVNLLGHSLASRSERPNLPWTFVIVRSDEVNAYSAPGGLVIVTRGLLKHVKNEAQLAGVLAHEIAHVTGRHALNHYRPFKESACKTALALKVGAKGAEGAIRSTYAGALAHEAGFLNFDESPKALNELSIKLADALSTTRFDPKQEEQADYDAVSLLIAAGYQPKEYVALLESLPPVFQSKSHPPKSDRVASVNGALKLFADPKAQPLRASGAPFGEAEGFVAPPVGPELASVRR